MDGTSSTVAEPQKPCNEVSVDENEVPVDEKPNEMTDGGEEELTLAGLNKRVDVMQCSIQKMIQDAALLVAQERALDDDDDDGGVEEPPTTVTAVPSEESRSEQFERRLQPFYVTERYNHALFRYQIVKEPKEEAKWYDGKPFAIRTRVSRYDGSETHFLDIKSSSLQAELKAVLGNIPNVNLDVSNPEVELKVFYHCIWKLLEYRNKIQKQNQGGESVEDKREGEVEKDGDKVEGEDNVKGDKEASNGGLPKESLSEDFELLIYWAEKYYNSVQADLDAVEKRDKIRFNLLWAFFKPKSVLFSRDTHLGVPLCATYISGLEKTDKHGQPFFEIVSLSLGRAVNGKPEYTRRTISIPYFWGEKEIQDVEAYPLEHHADKERIREKLIRRGHKYVGLSKAEFTHLAFDGTCFFINAKNEEETQYDNHRIIVDAWAFNKFAPAMHPVLKTVPFDKEWNNLGPDELLICNPTVFGYVLHIRRFAEVGVDHVSPIQWNESASFENDVILRYREKKAIAAVALQTLGKPTSNGAMGQFMVFHGGPGVGKTLTVNVLAEQNRRVLYEFSASKHESGAENLERDVDIVLILCNRWKAVLLMDEGDVYLAERGKDHDHDHAAVVAVFLRHIERYSGLLIVTTNRWHVIDHAIKSRVTLPVKYPSMSDDHQVALWRSMLADMGREGRLSEHEIAETAAIQRWNGRQIKDCVKLAGALAGDAPLAFEYLQEAALLQMEDNDEDQDEKAGAKKEDEPASVEVQK